MLRISKLTDYATLILAHLPEAGSGKRTATEVAALARVAPPTVSKVLKELHRAGLVTSSRGVHGGYCLARAANTITAADIIDAVEGPVALTECASSHHQCDLESSCRVGASWQRVSLAIRAVLAEVTLHQLTGGQPSAQPSSAVTSRDGIPVFWRARV